MIIDFGFGLSQLSGSEDLLITLLGKIRAEYIDCEQKFLTLFENQQWEEAKVIAHTLKGVSGNLGCTALHQATKAMDDELKNTHAKPSVFDEFVTALNATLEQIKLVEQAGTVEIEATVINNDGSINTDSKQELIDLLNDNAFISPDTLDEHLLNLNVSDQDKRDIEQYINILDYTKALDILTR